MASACMVLKRGITTSCICYGKRNFRKFLLYNKRGSRAFKMKQATDPCKEVPIDKRGVRDTGFKVNDAWVQVPEMVPELIVPSLEGFKLKPYVSYKVEDITEPEFTAKDLFDAVYSDKIIDDFKNDRLSPNGEPLSPSEYESLTVNDAKELAEKTGCDIFSESMMPHTKEEEHAGS